MARIYSKEDLQARTQVVIEDAIASKEPVYINQNGKASVIMIDADTYLSDMQALREFKRIYKDAPIKATKAPDTASTEASDSSAGDAASQEAGADKKYAWRCTICGYMEYADELPDDYACPLCGAGKDAFERVEV